jgi:uncharacterized membrane protein YdbT with pleckstrin-like domain
LTLESGERVHLRAAPSKNLLLAGIAGGMALLVCVSAVVAVLGDIVTGRILSFLVLVLVLAILGITYLFVNRWEYAMTSDRACVAGGLRTRDTHTVPLDEVAEVSVDQSRWQRLVNVGDLLFVTERRTLRFDSVEDPRRVYERVVASLESTR